MLVGNNVVLVIYGILIAQLFDNTIFRGCTAGFTVPADTILSTLIMLFTGEFLPKSLFKSIPNTMLTVFSPIAYVFYIILWPISKFATFLSKAICASSVCACRRKKATKDLQKWISTT